MVGFSRCLNQWAQSCHLASQTKERAPQCAAPTSPGSQVWAMCSDHHHLPLPKGSRQQSITSWKGHKSPSGWTEGKVSRGVLPINSPRAKAQYQLDVWYLHVPHKARKALSLPLHRSSTQDTFILKLLPTTCLWQASFLNLEWYMQQPEYQKTGLKIQRMWHWHCARQQAQF